MFWIVRQVVRWHSHDDIFWQWHWLCLDNNGQSPSEAKLQNSCATARCLPSKSASFDTRRKPACHGLRLARRESPHRFRSSLCTAKRMKVTSLIHVKPILTIALLVRAPPSGEASGSKANIADYICVQLCTTLGIRTFWLPRVRLLKVRTMNGFWRSDMSNPLQTVSTFQKHTWAHARMWEPATSFRNGREARSPPTRETESFDKRESKQKF